MARTILRLAIILATGSCLGLAWNAFLVMHDAANPGAAPRGLPLRANALLKPGDEEINIPEAKKRFDKGYLFLDARPHDFYPLGHIAGALSLPEDDFDSAFAKLEPRLRGTLDIVVYCSGMGCDASHLVAHKLKEHGIEAAIMPGGWPDWTAAGYPTKKGDEP
jgi:rhodanese-related sulfurtransferase